MSAIDWNGPSRQECPSCSRGPKDRTCGVKVDERGGVAHCFRCGYRETDHAKWEAPRRPPAPTKHEWLSDYGHEMWRTSRLLLPGIGDGPAYLKARFCAPPPLDGDLRWHTALKHKPSGHVGPALVALVTDVLTGRHMTLHRTWICADGNKAPVDPPRMFLGNHYKAGGVVRLWPDEAVTTSLGIGEGIETTLSLAIAHTPVWACLDAGNLAAFPVLDGVECLTIAADNDDAGRRAADLCAERWAVAGRDVRIVMSQDDGEDLNDLARAP